MYPGTFKEKKNAIPSSKVKQSEFRQTDELITIITNETRRMGPAMVGANPAAEPYRQYSFLLV